MHRPHRLILVVTLVLCGPYLGRASAEAPTTIAGKTIAVLPFDALGLEGERVGRLESLFRQELGRLSGKTMPSPVQVEKAQNKFRRCSGGARCLAAIGRELKVDYVLAGNVAALGDSYVVNIKAIDSNTKQEVRRVASDPLRDDPDELIETVRVAAYRLLAPNELVGSISLLADMSGATVIVDGKPVGKTPMTKPIGGLALGDHDVEVRAEGYSRFKKTVQIRFQKETRVVVRQAEMTMENAVIERRVQRTPATSSPPWYKSKWMLIGASTAAVVVGGVIGYTLSKDNVVDCTEMSSCM